MMTLAHASLHSSLSMCPSLDTARVVTTHQVPCSKVRVGRLRTTHWSLSRVRIIRSTCFCLLFPVFGYQNQVRRCRAWSIVAASDIGKQTSKEELVASSQRFVGGIEQFFAADHGHSQLPLVISSFAHELKLLPCVFTLFVLVPSVRPIVFSHHLFNSNRGCFEADRRECQVGATEEGHKNRKSEGEREKQGTQSLFRPHICVPPAAVQ